VAKKKSTPVVRLTVPTGGGIVGVPYTVKLSISDKDNDLKSGSLFWGDGVADTWQEVPPTELTHVYTTAKTFTLRVTALDKQGGQGVATADIVVKLAEPIPEPPEPITGARLYLTPSVEAAVTKKRQAGDSDWQQCQRAADVYQLKLPPWVRVISATNSNPVRLQTDAPLPWKPGTTTICYIVGATGSWAAINNNPPKGAWTATASADGTASFTIPVDATTFGPLQGTLTVWVYGNLSSEYLDYGQSADQWWDAAFTLSLCYRQTTLVPYQAAVMRFFDWWCALGVAGLDAPVSQDSGRGSFGVQPAVTTVYDWLYAQLSEAQRTAAVTALNRWNAWTDKNGESRHSATSNYWEGHQLAFLQTGYATQDENSQAEAWLTLAEQDWQSDFVPFFLPPQPGQQIYGSNEGFYYSGTAVSGFNYGGNDIARHVQRMFLIKSATGGDTPDGIDYATRWVRNLFYQLRPDRWKAPTHGQWTGDMTGVMKYNDAIFLSAYLAGQQEGKWVQWYLQHSGVNAPNIPPGAKAFADGSTEYKWRLLFYDPDRPAEDYTQTLPPYFFADGGEPAVHWRTGWDEKAISLIFRCGPGLYNGSLSKQGGHVDIYRGTDYLLVQSNYFKGTTDGLSGVPHSGDLSNALANTLDFYDDATICYPRNYPYVGCQMLGGKYRTPLVRLTRESMYAENEFASAYDSQGASKNRTLKYWFRTTVSFGQETVIWDRVKSTKPTHRKVLPWHLPGTTPTEVSAAAVDTSIGASRLRVVPITSHGAVRAIQRNQVQGVDGNWRVEITDQNPHEEFTCLTAMLAQATGAVDIPVMVLDSDPTVVAVQVGQRVIVLPVGATELPDGTFESLRVETVAFTSTHGGDATYLIGGLKPGHYVIQGALNQEIDVPADGVATFTAKAGSFVIGTGAGPIPPDPEPPNGDVDWTSDLVLAYGQTFELIGTPTARKVLKANGHHIAVDGGGSWNGILQLDHADIYDLGSTSYFAISDNSGWSYAYLNGATVKIRDCRFFKCGRFNLYSVNNAVVAFDRNEYGDTNLCKAEGPADKAEAFFTEQGNSTAAKSFTGNRVTRGTAILGSPNWTVGGKGQSNYTAGRRVGISVLGDGSVVSYNYSRVTTDVTPQEGYWSQVGNYGPFGPKVKVFRNIIRGGHWPVSGLDGELYENVISEAQGHDWIRIGKGGKNHHNLLIKPYAAFAQYGEPYGLASAIGLYQDGNELASWNLTIDARGKDGPSQALAVVKGAKALSWRNIVVYRLRLGNNGCPQGAGCTSAVGGSDEGSMNPPPERLDYADYNCHYFEPGSDRTVVYNLAVPGKTLGQPGYGGHDLGTLNGPGPDPRFRGPLPIGTGQAGVPSPNDGGFPFNEDDILNGTYSVADLCDYFFGIYAPAPDSPLKGKQDPQDGAGDIGASQLSKLPPTVPAIITTNKPPMVYAGPSFTLPKGTICYLTGWAADDGLPNNLLSVAWNKVSGPGTVTFADAQRANTTATFSAPGEYVLRLTADDGDLARMSDCRINVLA